MKPAGYGTLKIPWPDICFSDNKMHIRRVLFLLKPISFPLKLKKMRKVRQKLQVYAAHSVHTMAKSHYNYSS